MNHRDLSVRLRSRRGGDRKGLAMRVWVNVTAAFGTVSLLASCSGSSLSGESTSSVSQAVSPPSVQTQYSARVCQLIGDYDYSAPPNVVATKNQTTSRFGIRGTDEGSVIFDPDDQKIFFYFGDTNPDGKGYDVVGWTTDLTPPDDGCPLLTFGGQYTDDAQQVGAPVVTIDGEHEGIDQAPNGGFYSPDEHRLYLFYNVVREGNPGPTGEGRTVLTWADPGLPHLLHSVNTSPFNGPSGMTLANGDSQFLMVAPIVVKASALTPSSNPFPNIPGDSNILLIYGSTAPFHAGTMQLAAVPLNQLSDATAYLYKTDTGWSSDHTQATPLFTDTPACDGEVSVMQIGALGGYLMAYVCGQPESSPTALSTLHGGISQGVFVRSAQTPLGPWSDASVLFDTVRDGAIGNYLHDGNPRATVDLAGQLIRTADDTCSIDSGNTLCCSEPAVAGSCSDPLGNRAPDGFVPTFTCVDGQSATLIHPSCEFPKFEESSPNGPPGCCTNSSHCCDLAFTNSEFTPQGFTAWGSSQSGRIYNPYFIAPYTQTTATIQGTPIPSTLTISYNLSTWNPYVVDVIKSSINVDDADGDTVPNEIDNCPLVPNQDQANCNLEAEQAWNLNNPNDAVQLLGDVCDPVPCPKANSDVLTSITDVSCFPPDRQPSLNTVCTYHEIHNEIDLTPTGSYVVANAETAVRTAVEHVEPNVGTEGRFCEITPLVTCTDSPSSEEQDSELSYFANAESERFNPSHPWHRITLTTPPGVPFIMLDRDAPTPFRFNYGGANGGGAIRWAYSDDDAFWKLPGVGSVIGTPDPLTCSSPSLCLNGRLWMHADTNVGQTIGMATDGSEVGFHGGGANGTSPGLRSLANYYFASEPDTATFEEIPGVGVLPRGYRFAFRTLGDPGPGDREVAAWQKYEQGNAIPIFLAGEQVLGLRQTSALVDATPSFGASFTHELRGTLPWLSAPGPTSVGANVPIAVEMSADGTSIAGTANLVGAQVLLGRNVELVAEVGTTADNDLGATANVLVPSALNVLSGNAGNGGAVLAFDVRPANNSSAAQKDAVSRQDQHQPPQTLAARVHCLYAGGASTGHPTTSQDRALGTHYNFVSCDNGAVAGNSIAITGAHLQIQSGDSIVGVTQVEAALNPIETSTSDLTTCNHGSRGTATPQPRPRRDFVATYAPTLNGVFLVGGTSMWNEHLTDVWFKPLDGPWQQVNVPDGTLGHVIDAAYSPADGRLWVLDEAESTARDVGRWSCHHQPTVRLLRIERERSSIAVVASATPKGHYQQRGLLTDRDGQILVYASSTISNTHRVARLVPDSNTFDAFVTDNLAYSLTTAPLVDYGGYAFIEPAPRTSRHAFTMDRRASLPFSPATLSSWTELLQ
jgi:hypothetical protein